MYLSIYCWRLFLFLSVLTSGLVLEVDATGLEEVLGAFNGLMSAYNLSSGLWDSMDENTPWWQSAIALQSTLDFMQATNSPGYLTYVTYTINRQRAPVPWWPQGGGDFRADSTDDTGWWALALLSTYSITDDPVLLDIAIEGEAYMSQYWTRDCNGGLIWHVPDLSYKAAISNELYIELTATLHNLIPGESMYLVKSLLAWRWFCASGMINDGFLVNDGLATEPGNTCLNNNAPTWTYNQGVILGALTQLFVATGDIQYLSIARSIADAVISSPQLAPDGILTEACPGEGCTGADHTAFKGIFMRYLAKLNMQLPNQPYSAFILSNAAVAYANDRLEEDVGLDFYGFSWQGPFDQYALGSQTSAVMLLTAALSTSGGILGAYT